MCAQAGAPVIEGDRLWQRAATDRETLDRWSDMHARLTVPRKFWCRHLIHEGVDVNKRDMWDSVRLQMHELQKVDLLDAPTPVCSFI